MFFWVWREAEGYTPMTVTVGEEAVFILSGM